MTTGTVLPTFTTFTDIQVDIGDAADDGTGDDARTAFNSINGRITSLDTKVGRTSGEITPTFVSATGSYEAVGGYAIVTNVIHIHLMLSWDSALTGTDVIIDFNLPSGSFGSITATDGAVTYTEAAGSGSLNHISLTTPTPIGMTIQGGNLELLSNYNKSDNLQYTELATTGHISLYYTGLYVT